MSNYWQHNRVYVVFPQPTKTYTRCESIVMTPVISMTENETTTLELERLREIDEGLGTDDVIELYGEESGFSKSHESENRSFTPKPKGIIYTNFSG